MNEHDQPLDAADTALLAALADLYDAVDPPPPTLDDDVLFAVTLAALDAEAATLLQAGEPALRAATDTGTTDTVTFTSSSLQLMIRPSEEDDGSRRIDAWVTGGGIDVALVCAAGTRWQTSDAHGRLVWRSVPRGPASFLLRPPEPGARPVKTPIIEL